MSANDKFDREFEAFLNEEDSKLSAIYRKLPQPEPDARLDAAVLAMAHRALNPELVATPPSRHRTPQRRWLPAFGAAAGIVFAAGIALRLGQQNLQDRPDVGSHASEKDVVSVRSLDAPSTPPLLSPAPPPSQAGAPALAARDSALKPQEAAGVVAATPPPPAPAPVVRQKIASEETSTNAPGTSGGFAKAERPANAAQAQAFPAPEQERKRSASEMDAVERKQAIAAGAWQNLHEREAAAETARAAQPAAAGEPALASSPPPASATMAAPTTAAKPALLDKKASSEQRDDQVAALPPDKWLAHIHELLRSKQHDEAVKSLAEFRKQYPQYRLPADLRDLH